MKKLLLIAAAICSIAATVPVVSTPASAQVVVGAGPGGVGVRVGERHRGYYRDRYVQRPRCRTIRERIVTPRGRVIYRSTRVC